MPLRFIPAPRRLPLFWHFAWLIFQPRILTLFAPFEQMPDTKMTRFCASFLYAIAFLFFDFFAGVGQIEVNIEANIQQL